MKIANLFVAFLLALTLPAMAQTAPDRGKAQPAPPGPVQIPDAPQLPYHFGARPVAPNGEKFGNVAAVALMPNGDLLVFNRNPAIMMVEYDPTGTKVMRVFNPNIAMNPHGMRVDRHGNIWAIDSFLNVIFKLNPKGDVLKMFGTRGENAPWDDSQVERHVQPAARHRLRQGRQFLCGAEPWRHLARPPTAPSAPPMTTGPDAPKSVPVSHPPVLLRLRSAGDEVRQECQFHGRRQPGPCRRAVSHHPYGDRHAQGRSLGRRPRLGKDLVFDKDLKNRREIQEQNLTCGFYVDAKGQLWMSTGRDGMVLKMGWDGKVLGWFGKHGDNPDSNDIGEGHYLAVSKDQKTIWVADTVLAHVLKLEHN